MKTFQSARKQLKRYFLANLFESVVIKIDLATTETPETDTFIYNTLYEKKTHKHIHNMHTLFSV